MRITVYRTLVAVLLVGASFVATQGQIQHGTVTGVVVDPTGA